MKKLTIIFMTTLLVVSLAGISNAKDRFCYDKNGKRVHTHTIEQLNTLLDKGVIVKIIESDGYIFFYNGDSNNNRMIKSIDRDGNIFFYNEKKEVIQHINTKPLSRLVMGCNPTNLSFQGESGQNYGYDKNGKKVYTTEITHCYDKNGKEIYPETIAELEYFLSKGMVVKIVIAYEDVILFYHGNGENYRLTSILNPHPSRGCMNFFNEKLKKIIEVRINGSIRIYNEDNETRIKVIEGSDVVFTNQKHNMAGTTSKDGGVNFSVIVSQ